MEAPRCRDCSERHWPRFSCRGSKPGVAQKVERRPSKSEAAGSSPRRPVQLASVFPGGEKRSSGSPKHKPDRIRQGVASESGSEVRTSLHREVPKCDACGGPLPRSLGKRPRLTCSGACRTAKARGKSRG